jgi:hypothetical protein
MTRTKIAFMVAAACTLTSGSQVVGRVLFALGADGPRDASDSRADGLAFAPWSG